VKRAFVLNLDADEELAGRPSRELGREARARLVARSSELGLLVGDAYVLGTEDDARARGLVGLAFCPTPRALATLTKALAVPAPAPSFEVLARVNHRKFCADLGQTLQGAAFVHDLESVASRMREREGIEWVLKHPHGYVGRMRHRTFALDARTTSFAVSCLEEAGGLELEPWVARTDDYALHGYVARDGALTLGEPTRQICDGRGVWQKTSREHDLSTEERAVLVDETQRVGRALVEAGYFGPFGVDAFRYLDAGEARFHPRCEINARYTMGYAVGMGDRRPDLV
jgi:hypothetical protein